MEWRKNKIDIIDTSGNGSFLVETRIALDVADAAVLVVSANEGVQVYTEMTWEMADEAGLPRCIVISRLDRENSAFDTALDNIRKNLTSKAVAVQLPIGSQTALVGQVDIITMKAYRFSNEGRHVAVGAIPPDMAEAARKAREALYEAIATTDDALLEKYLESGTLSDDDGRKGLAAGIRNRAIVPVLAASGGLCLGIQTLLDFVVDALPSPLDCPAWRGKQAMSRSSAPRIANAPVAAYASKTASSDIGRLSHLARAVGKLQGVGGPPRADMHARGPENAIGDFDESRLSLRGGGFEPQLPLNFSYSIGGNPPRWRYSLKRCFAEAQKDTAFSKAFHRTSLQAGEKRFLPILAKRQAGKSVQEANHARSSGLGHERLKIFVGWPGTPTLRCRFRAMSGPAAGKAAD